MIMDKTPPRFISVEDVAINKRQTQFVSDLRKELLAMGVRVPIRLYTPRVKKEDRIKFNLEALMSQKGLKFNRNVSDRNRLFKAERQFLEFPFSDRDDIIDTISQGAEVFKYMYEEATNRVVEIDHSHLL